MTGNNLKLTRLILSTNPLYLDNPPCHNGLRKCRRGPRNVLKSLIVDTKGDNRSVLLTNDLLCTLGLLTTNHCVKWLKRLSKTASGSTLAILRTT